MGHVSHVSHLVTVHPLKNRNLMNHRVAPSTTDNGSPMRLSLEPEETTAGRTGSLDSVSGLTGYAAVSRGI
jgi:hypothetical protein